MDRTILVPLDGSATSEAVLPYVVTIAKGMDCEVTLLYAVDLTPMLMATTTNAPLAVGYLEDFERQARESGQEYLRQQCRRLEGLGVRCATLVEVGRPADVILQHDERDSPWLIALSTHGRSGLARLVLGSVASRLLQTARSPLLLVRPRDETLPAVARLDEVIVPLDASPLAEGVLPLVVDLASGLRLAVTLVQALPTASQLYMGTEIVAHPADILERAEQAVREYLQGVASRLEQQGLQAHLEVLSGEAGSAIVEFARQRPHNIIAMTTHGRSGLGRWVLGSVTDKVVRSSGDPVVVVRPRQ